MWKKKRRCMRGWGCRYPPYLVGKSVPSLLVRKASDPLPPSQEGTDFHEAENRAVEEFKGI